jgi:BirA family biotin operon repressor/biotin-[acetyl-CoA-carboxylase] ligase
MPELGLPRLHHAVLESTNATAKQLAAGGAPHGTTITASRQTAGRGRQGRTWEAPAGRSLLCSVVLRDAPVLLPLITGVAVADTIEAHASPVSLKWPNDVLLDGRKVSGILAEGRPGEGWAVVGVGINVAVEIASLPPELSETAATLGLLPEDVEAVLELLLRSLERRLDQSEGEILDAFRARDHLSGREVSWSGGVGVGAGIDGTGRLIVDGVDGVRHVLEAGEVHLGLGAS